MTDDETFDLDNLSDESMHSADEEDNGTATSLDLSPAHSQNLGSTPAQVTPPPVDNLVQTLELIQQRIASLQVQFENKLADVAAQQNAPTAIPPNISKNRQRPHSGRRGRHPQHLVELQVSI
jgi:hypothetical protein